jgi:hypothetical protein
MLRACGICACSNSAGLLTSIIILERRLEPMLVLVSIIKSSILIF